MLITLKIEYRREYFTMSKDLIVVSENNVSFVSEGNDDHYHQERQDERFYFKGEIIGEQFEEDWQGIRLLSDNWLLSNFVIKILEIRQVHFSNGLSCREVVFTVTRHDDEPVTITQKQYNVGFDRYYFKKFS